MAMSSDFRTHGPSRLSRRTVMEGLLAGSALALVPGHQAGLAEGTPEAIAGGGRMQPNMYTLRGGGTTIGYSSSSLTGEPTFTYEGPDIKVDARGDEIHIQPAQGIPSWPLGGLFSIYVDAAPDAWARSLTLMLPEINLVDGGDTPFTTFAVLTTHFTNIGGPRFVEGQFQEYEVIALEGTASAVLF